MFKFLIFLTLYLDIAVPEMMEVPPIWSYDDETGWPGYRCKEGGRRQSPIDIRTTDVVKDFEGNFIKYGALKFRDYDRVLVSGYNNGHNVQFSTDGEETMHPTVTGGPLEHVYRLQQLQFHWLSEHAIDGTKYPMEIHFVHVRADLPVATALTKKDGLAIISIFCNVKAELDEHEEEVSQEIMEHIPNLMTPGDKVSGVILNLTKLLGNNKESYFSYLGSLTLPECNEVVIWIIFRKPIYLSDMQYHQFSKSAVGRHNFRSLQGLSHHQVFAPPSSFFTTPTLVQSIVDIVRVVTKYFKKFSRFVTKGMKTP